MAVKAVDMTAIFQFAKAHNQSVLVRDKRHFSLEALHPTRKVHLTGSPRIYLLLRIVTDIDFMYGLIEQRRDLPGIRLPIAADDHLKFLSTHPYHCNTAILVSAGQLSQNDPHCS